MEPRLMNCPHGYPLDDPNAEPCYREGCYEPRPELQQCDCCGEMKPNVRHVYVAMAGDTNVCEDCSR